MKEKSAEQMYAGRRPAPKKLKDPRVMTLLELQKEVGKLRRRLEMTHHYVSENGKLVRKRGYFGYDAIDCRNETIRALERDKGPTCGVDCGCPKDQCRLLLIAAQQQGERA